MFHNLLHSLFMVGSGSKMGEWVRGHSESSKRGPFYFHVILKL